jgi:hypothetical protein
MARKFGEFCEGWFEAALTAPDGPNAIDVLPFVAVMHQGVERRLKVWSRTAGRRADEQLAAAIRATLPDPGGSFVRRSPGHQLWPARTRS